MDTEKVKETLEKQLQLLSERSEDQGCDLVGLSHAICEIITVLAEL